MLELKSVLAHLVRKYTFRLNDAFPAAYRTRITMTPRNSVHLFVAKLM